MLRDSRFLSLRRMERVPTQSSPSWLFLVAGILRVETCAPTAAATGGFLKKGELHHAPGSDSPQVLTALRAVLSSDVYIIPATTLETLVLENPRLALKLIHAGESRCHRLHQSIGHLTSAPTVEAAIGRTLIELSVIGEGGRALVDRRITQREMAESLGYSREQVNKVLRQLEAQGSLEKCEEGYVLGERFIQSHAASAWRVSRLLEEEEVARINRPGRNSRSPELSP